MGSFDTEAFDSVNAFDTDAFDFTETPPTPTSGGYRLRRFPRAT